MLQRHKMFHLSSIAVLSLSMGCAKIPDSDINFLDRSIPLGMNAKHAQNKVERRGFLQRDIHPSQKYRFDKRSQRFAKVPTSFRDTVQRNIGFVKLKGEPQGQLDCFARSYALFIASGDRLICWTTDDGDKITWPQAGWRGFML